MHTTQDRRLVVVECCLAFRGLRLAGVCHCISRIIVILAFNIYHRLLFIVF